MAVNAASTEIRMLGHVSRAANLVDSQGKEDLPRPCQGNKVSIVTIHGRV
jgi:hypothetical protein